MRQKHGQMDGRLVTAVSRLEYHLWTGGRRVESVYKLPDGTCRPIISVFISQHFTVEFPLGVISELFKSSPLVNQSQKPPTSEKLPSRIWCLKTSVKGSFHNYYKRTRFMGSRQAKSGHAERGGSNPSQKMRHHLKSLINSQLYTVWL